MPWNAVTIPIVVPSKPTNAQAALQLGRDDEHLPLDCALGGVDVGGRDGRPVAQQRFHFGERLTQHARDVALLVLLGERDRAVELLLLQIPRELRRELPRLLLRFSEINELGNAYRPRPGRHYEHDDHNAFGERPHRCP
jgi:hypothetical protein